MPFSSIAELPDSTKGIPAKAKEIYMKAFNSQWDSLNGDPGREAKAHATAWAAVKRVYHKVDDNWIRRESMSLSDKNRQNLLTTALVAEYGLTKVQPIPKVIKVDEVFPDHVVYNVDGQLYKASYEIDEVGRATFGEPEKVLATKMYSTMEAMTMENKRALLEPALSVQFAQGKENHIWIEDFSEAEVVYRQDNQSFKVNYTMAEDGVITFGDPVKVAKQVTYKPLESLRETYSEIIQEAGRRNASLDSGRIKKIVEICQELLSSEGEIDDKIIKRAVAKANEALSWLKEQPAVKIHEGIEYPSEAFAYVPDPANSNTWLLRMWENLTKKVTKGQLDRAAAMLSVGGPILQAGSIDIIEIAAMKRRLRNEYRNLGQEDNMSRWVKEVEVRDRIIDYMPLTEAQIDKGRATVIVIKPGFNATKERYYPAEMLKRDFKIFENMKMFADHPTDEEDKARPERSIRDWVATLSEVKCDENGVVTGVAEIVEPWLMKKLAALREKKMLSDMGISINAVGSASKATIDGTETLVIEKLVAAKSVDFVTEPGAGGIVTFYESDRSQDVDLVDLSVLKEKRPDLIKAIEADVREKITKEAKMSAELEAKVKDLEGQVDTLTTKNTDLETKMTEAEKEKAKAEAQAIIKEAVDKAELPDAAKAKLKERFKDAESDEGIKEAIKSEIAYIASLAEAGKVKGMGPTETDSEKDIKALRESLKRSNPEWTEEQLEAAVTGR